MRLPTVHPGTPSHYRVKLTVRVVKATEKAYQIQLADNEGGAVWVPRSVVTSLDTDAPWRDQLVFLPLWLYAKVKDSL